MCMYTICKASSDICRIKFDFNVKPIFSGIYSSIMIWQHYKYCRLSPLLDLRLVHLMQHLQPSLDLLLGLVLLTHSPLDQVPQEMGHLLFVDTTQDNTVMIDSTVRLVKSNTTWFMYSVIVDASDAAAKLFSTSSAVPPEIMTSASPSSLATVILEGPPAAFSIYWGYWNLGKL